WNNLSSDLIVVGQELDMNGANVTEATPANDNKQAQSETAEPETTEVSNKNTEESTPVKKETKEEPKSEQTSKDTTKQANQTEGCPEGKINSVTSTAYTAECDGCSGDTSTGVDIKANQDAKVIADDPNVIPLISKVDVEGYGYATPADTGGAINGNK